MIATAPDWHASNKAHLAAALDVVRAVLASYTAAAGLSVPPGTPLDVAACRRAMASAEEVLPQVGSIERLATGLGLSDFERDIVLLCAGVELDASFARLCAAAQGHPDRVAPTFSLALAALPGAHWSALAPDAPLRRWHLIELVGDAGVTSGPLRIDERVLHFLVGVDYLDPRVEGVAQRIGAPERIPPSHQAIVEEISELWSHTEGDLPVVHLSGRARVGTQAIAAAAAATSKHALYAVRAGDLPTTGPDRVVFARLWEREAVLAGSILLIDLADAPRDGRAVRAFLEHMSGRVVLIGEEPITGARRPVVRLPVEAPTLDEQVDLWRHHLGAEAAEAVDLDLVASHFELGAEDIRGVALRSRARPSTVWGTCRVQARPRLDDLAQRVDNTVSWDDLVLAPASVDVLRQIVAQLRNRVTVHHRWGFGGRRAAGRGVSALFAGASGTGKTLAAEVLANETDLDLYRIDLSAVVSKYIGETEKNLSRVFDAAEAGGAILLFDEADALFGKRSEVKDSHDRYANIEVGYLLQRMEAYHGLAILTTNLKDAVDDAFLRRIRFVVDFQFPDEEQRALIWSRMFPPGAPVRALDFERLGQLSVSGGSIRNIAWTAAFLAADERRAIEMHHVLRAARTEYAKLERSITRTEIRGWS